jgi:hypothetical protein
MTQGGFGRTGGAMKYALCIFFDDHILKIHADTLREVCDLRSEIEAKAFGWQTAHDCESGLDFSVNTSKISYMAIMEPKDESALT